MPVCDHMGISCLTTLQVTHVAYKTCPLGFTKQMTLPVLQRPSYNIVHTVNALRRFRDTNSLMFAEFHQWPDLTADKISSIFRTQLRKFSKTLTPAHQVTFNKLRLTLHSLRKTGVRFYARRGLSETEIKNFSGIL